MRIAIDTNVLVYAEGLNDEARQSVAKRVLDDLYHREIILPAQVIGELFHALTRKYKLSGRTAEERIAVWRKRYGWIAADAATFDAALTLSASRSLQFWDALVLAAAAEARCQMLLSEDFQDGFVFRGVTVANPFAEQLHPLLQDALA